MRAVLAAPIRDIEHCLYHLIIPLLIIINIPRPETVFFLLLLSQINNNNKLIIMYNVLCHNILLFNLVNIAMSCICHISQRKNYFCRVYIYNFYKLMGNPAMYMALIFI